MPVSSPRLSSAAQGAVCGSLPGMLVRLDRHGPVALLTLDRPEKRNALSVALRRELAACFRALASDRDVCAMVLTGAGRAFCAGMDRSEFGGDADHRRDLFESSKELFASLGDLPIPAIAAINGPALGGEMARHGRRVLEETKRIIIETARG